MRFVLAALTSLAFVTGVSAQVATDPATMQRSIAVVQSQRNQALDLAAIFEVKANGLAEELAKAQARIKELEAAPK